MRDQVLGGAMLLLVCASCGASRPADTVDQLAEKCAAGDAGSCSNLGWEYYAHAGTQDWARAAQLCQKACDSANAQGCETLAKMYARPRSGVPHDEVKAVQLYQKACDGGVGGGCHWLAEMSEFGWNVAKDKLKAARLYQQAAQLFQKDCEGGSTADCYNAGQMYEHGHEGVLRDQAKAAQFYRRACDAGGTMGCYMLTQSGSQLRERSGP